MDHNMARFYGEQLLASSPITKLEDHTLSAVRYYLFNIFAATLHNGGRSYIRNLRTRHAVVTGTHLSWTFWDRGNRKERRLRNEELYDLHSSTNIIRVTKSGTMRQAGHVAPVGEKKYA